MNLWKRRDRDLQEELQAHLVMAVAMFPDLPRQHHLPLLFGGIVTVALAALAAFVPARRAAAVDPVQALRNE